MKQAPDFEETAPNGADWKTQISQRRAKSRGRLFLWFAYALPLTIYALVVLLAPSDVLDQYPSVKVWANSVHDTLRSVFSTLDIFKHARSTAFPQVATLTSALAFCVVVFIAAVTVGKGISDFHSIVPFMRKAYKSSIDRLGSLILLPILGVFSMWAFFCVGGDPSFAKGYTTQDRSGYLFFSTIAILFAGAGLGMWPTHAWLLISDIFSKGNHHE